MVRQMQQFKMLKKQTLTVGALLLGVVGVSLYGLAHAETKQAKDKQAPVLLSQKADSGVSPDLTKVDATRFLDPVPVGRKAPDFILKDAVGKLIQLSQFQGKKNVVLVFYQGSFCPVCGHQLENIQRHLKDFNTQDATVLAISADDTSHAKKSVGEHGLTFSVLPDPKKDIIKRYGVANIGRDNIAWPSSFVIDKKGIVRLSVADAQGKRLHSNEFLAALSKITGKPAPKLSYEE